MKISYAFRRTTFYPYPGARSWDKMPPKEVRRRFLQTARRIGFEGLELGVTQFDHRSEEEVRELRRELDGEGVPCVAIRGGGGVVSPRTGGNYRARWEEAIRIASWIGAPVVNSSIGGNQTYPGGPGSDIGERTSQGGSRVTTETEFQLAADRFREAADVAADAGIDLSIEMHQHSMADNSWSCLHLLDLIDRPNAGVNPDLGNLYWTYETPEETPEACITALAPRAKYWHCKQLLRVHVPELQKAYFVRVPLPDGDIDYRFAISAMANAGYQGYLAIEGCREGDQIYRDGKSVEYCRQVLDELSK